MSSGKYVTAFAGRRDGYQVAVALAEAGRLERLVTTFYLTPGWRRLLALAGSNPAGLTRRHAAGVPDDRVDPLLAPELVEHLGRRLRLPPPAYWQWVNDRLSHRAAAVADATGADLLLYEPYAPYAFRRRYRYTPRRVLFHFHVHPALETAIFRDDLRRHPPTRPWRVADGGAASRDPRNRPVDRVWRDADVILCASSFTRRTLEYAGANPAHCRVVPYGVVRPADCPPAPAADGFRPLFVGTGSQRKGLHHLLAVFR